MDVKSRRRTEAFGATSTSADHETGSARKSALWLTRW